jgi:restriction system protein
MKAWEAYQEQAAEFFRSLGMITNKNERLIGARGVHDVDVVVRKISAGIVQIWIVECKRWKRPINKLHVSALAEIVQDVGADRGILLSESGFQAGAARMAQSNNITLSSISDLEGNSEDERVNFGIYDLRQRLTSICRRIDDLKTPVNFLEEGVRYTAFRTVQGADSRQVNFLDRYVHLTAEALSDAQRGGWPITHYAADAANVVHRVAHNDRELLAGLEGLLAYMEDELIKQETSAHSAWEPKITRNHSPADPPDRIDPTDL